MHVQLGEVRTYTPSTDDGHNRRRMKPSKIHRRIRCAQAYREVRDENQVISEECSVFG